MDHSKLLLLLLLFIKFSGIGVILQQLWVLLKKQLPVSQLLGLLDIGRLHHEGVALIGPRTFISQICLIPIVIPIVRVLRASIVCLLAWLSTYWGCFRFAHLLCGCVFGSFFDFSDNT